jgi:uncharacterized protein YaiI (UPF0178 family)
VRSDTHVGETAPAYHPPTDLPMTIWVDADACPGVVKEILFRAAQRTGVTLTLVANQPLQVPKAPNITSVQVPQGFDVADNEIVQRVGKGDLVITADIPLAAEVIEKGATALSPRGEPYTAQNVRSALNMRDFMDTMRSSGVQMGGGPAAFGQRDKQTFANALDRWLTRRRTDDPTTPN